MAIPATKINLMEESKKQFNILIALLNSISLDEKNSDFIYSEGFLDKNKEVHWQREKNLKDVLIHLYEWQQLLLIWVDSNIKGEEKHFLPSPYNWQNFRRMNFDFIENHKDTSYNKAMKMIEKAIWK